MNKKIGFIGLGNVGEKLAFNLLKNNYQLYVYDLNKKKINKFLLKGATACVSIEELINKVDVFITCLPSPQSVKTVILKCLPNIRKKHLWIEMSTTDENDMKSLSNLIFDKKAEVVEAPITGGQHRAESGNISILVGGKRNSFERAFPILSCLGYQILHCGEIGMASTLKVVTNFLASINLLALGEALMVCKKYNLNLKTAYEGIRISSGNSFVHETETKVILNGSYDVGFTMDLVCKDVGLFDKLTKKFNIPAPLSKLILELFEDGRRELGDRALSTSIIKILEDKCKESLRESGFPASLKDLNDKKEGKEIKI